MPDYTYPAPDRLRTLLLIYLLHADGPSHLQTRTDLAHLAGVSEADAHRTYAEYEPAGSSDQNVWKAMVAHQISELQKEGLMTKKGDEGHRFDRQDLTEAGRKVAAALDDEEYRADALRLAAAAADEGHTPDEALDENVRKRTTTYRYLRDTAAAREAKRLAEYRCQVCNRKGILLPNGGRYAEAHHVKPLHQQGPDTLANLLCVCPTCHAALDYLAAPIKDDVAGRAPHLNPAYVAYHNQRVQVAAS